MAGKLFFKALTVLVFIAAIALYVLNVLIPSVFGIFDLYVCLILLLLGLGAVSLLKAVVSKVNVYLILAALLITGGLIWSGLYFRVLPADRQWLYYPIGAALLLAFVFFRYLFNIRKWDAGDNERLGYKDYHTRQAEKEKAEIDEDINGLNREIREKEKEKALLMMEIEDKQKEKDSIKKK